MGIKEAVRQQLAVRFSVLLPHLNERQRRLMLATEAGLLGHGGVRAVARVAGASETTVRRGLLELEADCVPLGGGRVRILVTLLYLRRVCSQRVLREMLEINDRTMSQVVTDTRLLLREHKVSIEPTALLFSTPDELLAYLRTGHPAAANRYPRSCPTLP